MTNLSTMYHVQQFCVKMKPQNKFYLENIFGAWEMFLQILTLTLLEKYCKSLIDQIDWNTVRWVDRLMD